MSINILNEMLNPETYDEQTSYVKVVQTHISWVFLTGKYAYKVKKPVNFGFLDYSTLEKRKFFCEQEVILNSRLSKELYLGALPIAEKGGKLKVNGEGNIVEYTVKMKELPSEALMSNLLKKNKVSKSDVQRIAEILSDFHSRALTGGEINEGGSLRTIKFNWDENFNQTRDFVGVTIEKEEFDEIKRKVEAYIYSNAEAFERRVKNGRIRDCHGDVHSGSIFITDKIYIFDCIEFNTRFRYSDVAAEVAFLSMDLDYHGREDLSQHFIESYVNYSSDEELLKLLPFYKCYRAYVRGKVTSFMLNDKNVSLEEKRRIKDVASKYFKLSLSYAKEL